MTEIPDDIWAAAENAFDNMLCNCKESSGGSAGLRKDSITDLAMAIVAERATKDAENERMREALEPFAEFAKHNIDSDGWGGLRCERERINVWFGPSDFIRARDAILPFPDPACGMPVEVET